MKRDEAELLRAAVRALDELSRRDRDTLEQAIVENKPIDEIAQASLISIERAAFWMDNARTQFRERLHAQAGVDLSPTEVFDLLAKALRQKPSTPVEEPAAAARCPTCGTAFVDASGQYAGFARLAREGKLVVMVGCTTCSQLFVAAV